MGKLAVLKTKENNSNVEDFINGVGDEQKRRDSFVLLEMMKRVAGEEPKMWGSSMIGFGKFRYKSPATGREVEWFKIGFSPRKANLSLHLGLHMHAQSGFLEKLGKHKAGKGCIYINKLEDVDMAILKDMMQAAVEAK